MVISISDPIVRVDGQRLPYFCTDNDFFKRLKRSLRDENIYDTSEASVPFSNRIVTFDGTTDPSVSLIAFNEYGGKKHQISLLTSSVSGTFEVSVLLRNGRNKITVESADASVVSNAIFMNAYKLHEWLCLYAEELEDVRNQTAQTRQDSKLRISTDFDGDAIDNTGRGLTESFGQFVSPLLRLDGFSVDDWRQGIRDVFESYGVAPSVLAMTLITRYFTGVDPEYRFYKDENRVRRPLFTDPNAFLASAGNPGVDRSWTWKETQIYLYNRWWTALASSVILPANDWSYIYFDGTPAATGTFVAQPIVSQTYPVVTGTRDVIETIASGDIRIDEDGKATGLSGELYVRATFPVSGLNGASGEFAPFDVGIDEAISVPSTSFIDLGHAQDGQDKRLVFGDVTISYRTPYEIFEVAQVKTDATTIVSAITGLRFDEVSGVVRETQVAQNAGEFIVWNSDNLASGVRTLLTGVLIDAKPPHTFWYVFMNDPSSGELVYYTKV
jgi:hypothetical protein